MSTETANPLTVLQTLVGELDSLMDDSAGVAGLHKNGDIATWDELMSDGRYPWLGSLDEARAVCVRPTPAPATSGADVTETAKRIAWSLHDTPVEEFGFQNAEALWSFISEKSRERYLAASRAVSPAPAQPDTRYIAWVLRKHATRLRNGDSADAVANWLDHEASVLDAPTAQQPQPADALVEAMRGIDAPDFAGVREVVDEAGTPDEVEVAIRVSAGWLRKLAAALRAARGETAQVEGRDNG